MKVFIWSGGGEWGNKWKDEGALNDPQSSQSNEGEMFVERRS